MMMNARALLLALLMGAAACGGDSPTEPAPAPEGAPGESARAELMRLDGIIGAPLISTGEPAVTDQDVCMNAGAHVLALHAHNLRRAIAFVGGPAGIIGEIRIAPDAARWAWTPFVLEETGCFPVTVINGRGAVYRLTVAVDWETN